MGNKLIKGWIFHGSDEIEIKFPFYKSFSTFWNVFSGLCTQIFYSLGWDKRWLEVNFVAKSKAIQPQPKYKTRNFQNLIRNRLLRDIHWKKKTNWNFKALLAFIVNTIIQPNSLFMFEFNNNLGLVIWCQTKVWIFLLTVLLNVYICALRKNSVLLFPKGTKICTHLTP